MDRVRTFALFSTLAACLPPRPVPAVADAGDDSPGITLRILDSLGEEHRTDAAPRRPRLEIEGAIDPDDPSTFPSLFRGAYDAALAEDAVRAPFTQASLARVVPVRLVANAGRATLWPSSALEPGAEYTVVLPAWAHAPRATPVGAPRGLALRIATNAAGAVLVETFPPAGSVGLPSELEAIDLRFDDDVDARTIALLDARGDVVPSDFGSVGCGSIGLEPGICFRVASRAPLAHGAVYTLDLTDVRDRFGDSVAARAPAFTTGDVEMAAAPLAVPLACAVDELGIAFACALVADEQVSLRARFATAARITAVLGTSVASTVTRSGEVSIHFDGLPTDSSLGLELRVRSLSGVEAIATGELRTTHALPLVVVDEIRADAIGPEPAQEFVELWNAGDASIDLAGYRIADAPDREGDALAAGCELAPHGRALVVADAFDASAAGDVAPVPGVPLCRVGASIGSGGLANSGEPLFLRDRSGVRVAEAPSVAAPGPGQCVVRVAPFARRASPSDYAAIASCTPGAPAP